MPILIILGPYHFCFVGFFYFFTVGIVKYIILTLPTITEENKPVEKTIVIGNPKPQFIADLIADSKRGERAG